MAADNREAEMNRFFVEKSEIAGASAAITGEDLRHMATVLRLSIGDEVALCDGEGTDYLARIEGISKSEARLSILSSAPSGTEPGARVTLFQGLPKAGKLETIIQKCVELGVYEIAPYLAKRSVVRPEKAEFEKRRGRYQKIAEEAAKQSRRGRIPEVLRLSTLDETDWGAFDAVIVPYEDERTCSLRAAIADIQKNARIALVIGPEGGFDAGEIAKLQGAGAKCVSLGKRILRTETAGMAALAMIMFGLEQME